MTSQEHEIVKMEKKNHTMITGDFVVCLINVGLWQKDC